MNYVAPHNFIKRFSLYATKLMYKPFWGALASAAVGLYTSSKQRKAQARAGDEARDAADLAYERSLPWDVKGMFGEAKYDEEGRQLDMSLSAPWQSEYDLAMAGAGNQREYIAGMEADPMAAGQKFYEMQKALYAPEQEQDRLNQESRLLAQGMLGSTGGASRIEALRSAQSMQDLQAQYAGLDKAQGMIDTYRGRAASDLGMAESIGQMPQKYAETGRGIGTGMSSIAGQAGKMQSAAAQAQGASTSSIYGGLAGQFQGLVNPQQNKYEQWFQAKQKYG
jgi:hypothetical protein